ncbi:MAG TPA: multiheme c-type cytochrome, partial [Rubricoccaceae bacterium]
MSGQSFRIVLPAAVLIAAAVAAASACRTPAPVAASDEAWTTVGDAACASCHADISETYERSAMGRSVSRFAREGAPEHFDAEGRSPVVCAPDDGSPTGGYCYQAFVRGDSLFQRETHPDEPGYSRVYAASHVVGSGNATRSYLMMAGGTASDTDVPPAGAEAGGYLTEMPLTWYVERQLWDLSPGYARGNLRFERPVTLECLTCHDAAPGHAPSQNFYTSVPLGISCERCHGPGSAHVEAFEAGGEPTETLIVNPAKLSTALQLDVCQQCHLTGQTIYAPGHNPTTYRPGRPLSAHRAVFVTEASLADPESFGIASHAERLVQSPCFQGSLGSPAPMTCTTCHDPHVAQAELPPDTYSAACRSCHTPEPSGAVTPGHGPLCDRAGATTPALALSGDCASCHMRRAGTSDIPHVSFTDHWIRKNPPPGRAGGPTETEGRRTEPHTLVNVVLREGELEGRAETPRPAAQSDAEAGLALFNFYEQAHPLPAYLPTSARLLRRGLAGGQDRTDVRIALGRSLHAMDSLAAAVAVLREAS